MVGIPRHKKDLLVINDIIRLLSCHYYSLTLCLPFSEGLKVGVGFNVGFEVLGFKVGLEVGLLVGLRVSGFNVGLEVGRVVGFQVGLAVRLLGQKS